MAGQVIKVFKMDTGTDGNLMPIKMFTVLFPKVSLDALSRIINKELSIKKLHCSHITTLLLDSLVSVV